MVDSGCVAMTDRPVTPEWGRDWGFFRYVDGEYQMAASRSSGGPFGPVADSWEGAAVAAFDAGWRLVMSAERRHRIDIGNEFAIMPPPPLSWEAPRDALGTPSAPVCASEGP